MRQIHITGANGQMGLLLKNISTQFPDYHFTFYTKSEWDIADVSTYPTGVQKGSYILNCAAYTAVDKAEQEVELALDINGKGVENLAKFSKKNKARIIHYSTDYVYAPGSGNPHQESDPVAPQSVYGKTKLFGEKSILDSGAEAVILRTSWLYSEYGNNFVKTMIRLGEARENITVVEDQVGSPTYGRDLAEATMSVIDKWKSPHQEEAISGIYNYCNTGRTTWYNFAKQIMKSIGTRCEVLPVSSEDYSAAAIRPAFSVLDTTKIQKTFDISPPLWEESLEKCLLKIRKHNEQQL